MKRSLLATSLLALVTTACGQPKTPAQQAADFATAEQCVSDHWGEPILQLAQECLAGEEAAAVDIITDIGLLLQKSGVTLPAAYTSHPKVADAMRRRSMKTP